MAYARPAPDRPRGAAVKAYWLEPRKRRRGDREPGLGLTPYSVEQADPDPRPWRDVGIKRGAALSRPLFVVTEHFRAPSVSNVPARFLPGRCARSFVPRGGFRAGRLAVRSLNVARPSGRHGRFPAQPLCLIDRSPALSAKFMTWNA